MKVITVLLTLICLLLAIIVGLILFGDSDSITSIVTKTSSDGLPQKFTIHATNDYRGTVFDIMLVFDGNDFIDGTISYDAISTACTQSFDSSTKSWSDPVWTGTYAEKNPKPWEQCPTNKLPMTRSGLLAVIKAKEIVPLSEANQFTGLGYEIISN